MLKLARFCCLLSQKRQLSGNLLVREGGTRCHCGVQVTLPRRLLRYLASASADRDSSIGYSPYSFKLGEIVSREAIRSRRGRAGHRHRWRLGRRSRCAALPQAPPMVAATYDWSGFYTGVNGGWGSSRLLDAGFSVGFGVGPRRFCITRWRHHRWPDRLPLAGRPASCSASKPRATGPTSRAIISAPSIRVSATAREIDPFGLFTGQVWLRRNNVRLCVKGGAAVRRQRRYSLAPRGPGKSSASAARPAGVPPSAPASNSPSRANWSVGVEYNHLFMQEPYL